MCYIGGIILLTNVFMTERPFQSVHLYVVEFILFISLI